MSMLAPGVIMASMMLSFSRTRVVLPERSASRRAVMPSLVVWRSMGPFHLSSAAQRALGLISSVVGSYVASPLAFGSSVAAIRVCPLPSVVCRNQS